MADYRRGCGCWTTHDDSCRFSPNYAAFVAAQSIKEKINEEIVRWRSQGFIYLGMSGDDGDRRQMLWGCRRGCGTVVWHIEKHIENVCPEFRPVVGNA